MNEKESLSRFLNGFPNSTHPTDRKNFLEYAISCVENDHCIDVESMKEAGVELENIEDYETAYSWIKDTMGYLSNRENL